MKEHGKKDSNMAVGVSYSYRDALLKQGVVATTTQAQGTTTVARIQNEQHATCSKTTKPVHFTAPTSSIVSIIHKKPRNDSKQVTLSEATKKEVRNIYNSY